MVKEGGIKINNRMMKDIENLKDIQLLVNTFYGRVQQDDLIGPIFNERLAGKWDYH